MTDSRYPEKWEAIPDNIVSIRDQMMFKFGPPELPEGEKEILVIEIGAWLKGAPITIRTIEVDGDRDDGIQALRNIGHSWQYDINNVAYLKGNGGKTYATLNIFNHTYRVDISGEEES